MSIDTKDPTHRVLTAKGCRVLVTTVRVVILPPAHTVNFRAFDIPFQGISAEKFVQPIFGANRLEMDVAMVLGRGLASGGPIHATLTFNEGGCNRFLRVFFALVEKNRQAISSPQAQAILAAPQAWVTSEMEAYVDPSDPSVIYVTQAPTSQQPVAPVQPVMQPQAAYAPAGAFYSPAPQQPTNAQPVYPQQQPAYAAQPGPGMYAPQPPAGATVMTSGVGYGAPVYPGPGGQPGVPPMQPGYVAPPPGMRGYAPAPGQAPPAYGAPPPGYYAPPAAGQGQRYV